MTLIDTSFANLFQNPLLEAGQDPSIVYHDGFYYFVQSAHNDACLTMRKSRTLTGLARAKAVVIFTPPPDQPYSYDLWAPELVYLNGEWFIYFAATEAPLKNQTHRMFVLKADSADPQGSWSLLGKVYDPAADYWAIDGVAFVYRDQLYFIWSGWEGKKGDFPQNLYIATMSDPVTLSSQRVMISTPDQSWERTVAAINEGPTPFIHNGQLSIVYSADASWTPAYKLGLLKLVGDDPLDPAAWEKRGPIFSQYKDPTGAVYGPGHNSMPVTSPDGSEYWLVYHAKSLPDAGWKDRRVLAQRFTWNDDNTPHFGNPIPAEVFQALPSGEETLTNTLARDLT